MSVLGPTLTYQHEWWDEQSAALRQETAGLVAELEADFWIGILGVAGSHPHHEVTAFAVAWAVAYLFETPPPMITKEGFKPLPPTGAKTLDSRTAFYYAYTLDSPGMIMRLPRVGSQYLMGFLDADKTEFDGAKTYKVILPKGIPAAAFWSFTLYDNQTRSMLDTPQRYPRAGSQSYPSPAAEPNPDGSTTVYFGPKQPEGVKRGNWIQTMPGKGWFTLLRLYSPLQPFFAKTWRPSEVELMR